MVTKPKMATLSLTGNERICRLDQNVTHYYITLYVVQHVITYLYVHIPTMAVKKVTTLLSYLVLD